MEFQNLYSKVSRLPRDFYNGVRWGASDTWCAELYGRLVRDSAAPRGLGVLVVRESAGAPDAISTISEPIHSHRFETLACEVLDQHQVASGTRYLRGGNWGKGPYPLSGGPPHTGIVVVDPKPTMPRPQAKAIHAGLENGRALELKETIRNWWNERRPDDEHCNILHTSDSAAEALHHIEVLFPGRAELLIEAAHALVAWAWKSVRCGAFLMYMAVIPSGEVAVG